MNTLSSGSQWTYGEMDAPSAVGLPAICSRASTLIPAAADGSLFVSKTSIIVTS